MFQDTERFIHPAMASFLNVSNVAMNKYDVIKYLIKAKQKKDADFCVQTIETWTIIGCSFQAPVNYC